MQFFFFFFTSGLRCDVCLGVCSPRKILKFRPYESASEAVGDHNKHAKFKAAGQYLRRFIVWSFLGAPSFSESAFVYEALPQNCLLAASNLSALCLQDMKQ